MTTSTRDAKDIDMKSACKETHSPHSTNANSSAFGGLPQNFIVLVRMSISQLTAN